MNMLLMAHFQLKNINSYFGDIYPIFQWRIQDLPKGGADHGERAEREPKRGSRGGAPWGRSPQRCPVAEPLMEVRRLREAPLKLKAFCTFLHKKVVKS